VNRGAIGCAVIAALAFIGLGVFALSLTSTDVSCPQALRWADLSYVAVGSPGPEPELADGQEPVLAGSTLFGLQSRDVYAPAGTAPGASGADRPEVLALDCGDGTYLAYRTSQ
jgi:hypothetical protein